MASPKKSEIYASVNGSFLLSRLTVGGIFFRSVVWISSFSAADGAKGVILNKPMGKTLGECTATFVGTPLARLPMFVGGPVEGNRLSVMACIRNFITGENEIMMGLPPEKIRDLSLNPAARLMAFAGFAAWEKGQLEDELASNTWLVSRVDFNIWQNASAGTLWRKLLEQSKKLDAQFMLRAPDNLSEN